MCTATHESKISPRFWTPALELWAILSQVYRMTHGFEH